MNCENCKKQSATVFYADEGGARHSLCASCAKILGKISQYDPNEDTKKASPYIPSPTLTSLCETPLSPIYVTHTEAQGRTVCPSCATALETACEQGKVGCPECYTVFSALLFPSSLDAENAMGARMPDSRRERIGRLRSISELKVQIKIAVEAENYELAATLRDKIRKLEHIT